MIDKNVEALIRIADRHYLIERGRVVWTGTSPELAAAPGDPAPLSRSVDDVTFCWIDGVRARWQVAWTGGDQPNRNQMVTGVVSNS